jgi:hypothetical protein
MMKDSSIEIERISFYLGMINCFVEMVACGVKTLALSPPLTPEDYTVIAPFSDTMVREFHICSYVEKFLLITDLQPEEFTEGKWIILYYEGNILKKYLSLKERAAELMKTGHYTGIPRKEISREFGRLLSYPEEKIDQKMKGEHTPFMLVE